MTFKKILLLFCFALINFFAVAAEAGTTIKLVVPFSPGSSVDNTARAVEKVLFKELDINTIVEYKLGAGGNIASEYAINDTGRDPVFLITSSSIAINSANKTAPFNLEKDLVPVAYMGTIPQVLVSSNQFAYKNLRNWSVIPTNTPITFASGGVGTGNHLNGVYLKNFSKKNMIHIPYKGASAMMPDLIGGRVDLAFDFVPTSQQFIKSGKITAIAVVSENRLAELPDTPTFAEVGWSNFGFETWYMIFTNRNTDPVLVYLVQQALAKTVADPEKSKPFKEAGLQFTGNDTLVACLGTRSSLQCRKICLS